jgi:hypothetical protein
MAIGLFDIIDRCLNESVSLSDVEKAIEGKYHVSIHYDDGQEPPRKGKGRRIIQPVAMGTTKRGFPVVRAFQTNGSSRRGAPKWKFFRLDRITSWVPMPNKKFETVPDPAYGEYNRVGDKTMGSFYKNAQFNEPESPLAAVQAKGRDIMNAPKVAVKNQSGPVIPASQQWKRNVFTSQPNSEKYRQYAKNIRDTETDVNRFDDDIWAKAEEEMKRQNDTSNDNNEYDVDEVDFDETDFTDRNKGWY